jgi:hypothetical protein
VAKEFDTFDFTAVPSLSKPKVLELARGEWIEQRANVCLIGSPGTGKTHITGLGAVPFPGWSREQRRLAARPGPRALPARASRVIPTGRGGRARVARGRGLAAVVGRASIRYLVALTRAKSFRRIRWSMCPTRFPP